MIVFTVSGLWHGAGWHFVAWGMLHGILRVFEEVTTGARKKIAGILQIRQNVFSYKLFQIGFTFFVVTIAWMFFRAESLRQAVEMIHNMFSQVNTWVLFDGSLFSLGLDAKDFNVLIVFIVLIMCVDYLRSKKIGLTEKFGKQNILMQWLVFLAGIWVILIFGVYGPEYDATQFIYFQF